MPFQSRFFSASCILKYLMNECVHIGGGEYVTKNNGNLVIVKSYLLHASISNLV